MGFLNTLIPFDELLTQGLFLEKGSQSGWMGLSSWRRSGRIWPQRRPVLNSDSLHDNELALSNEIPVSLNLQASPGFSPQPLRFLDLVSNVAQPTFGSFVLGVSPSLSNPVLASGLESAQASSEATTGLQFNFISRPGIPQAVLDGFIEAGNIWSTFLGESITLNMDIRFADLGSGILGAAIANFALPTYTAVREALMLDQQSSDDNLAVNSLPTDSIAVLTNHVLETLGTAWPFLDNGTGFNNTYLAITTSNAKALGLSNPGLLGTKDGFITLNSAVNWDFDRTDGIAPDAYDFVGVAVHEIGHALGFFTTVDAHDTLANTTLDWLLPADLIPPTLMDMYRFSEQSRDLGAIDHRLGTQDKYFSIDGGNTPLAPFATGAFLGNGNQASHWQDDLGLGIMDPTFDLGELGQVSALDLQMLDVMGWNLTLV